MYPSETNTYITVTTNVPNTAKEVLMSHNTLGDIHFTRGGCHIVQSYYIDEYYRISTRFEWKNNTIKYEIIGIGTAESYTSHYIHNVWYR